MTHVSGPNGEGVPQSTLPPFGVTPNDHPTGLVRMTLELLPHMADGSLWAFACAIELEMVRRRRSEVFDSRDISAMYSYSGPSFVELQRRRTTYDKPPRTPEEIREQVAASVADYEARHGLNRREAA